MRNAKKQWIDAGFTAFAMHGPDALKIDHLARHVGKSRSSFYYNFVDQEDYIDGLIDNFLLKARQMKAQTDLIETFIPDYIEWWVSEKDYVFFSKHVFLNMNVNPKFKKAWDSISDLHEDKSIELWMRLLNMSDLPQHQARQFYETIRSATMTRLEYDTFTFKNLKALILDVNKSFEFLLDK